MLFKVWGVENELRGTYEKATYPFADPYSVFGKAQPAIQELNERKCHATPQFV
jgi:hypothetical protein